MINDSETLDALLERLASTDPKVRNAAALRLQEFAEAAGEVLCHQMERPENRRNRGTLIHVLGAFNCSSRFPELIRWAVRGNYEVQCHALMILDAHRFVVTPTQLRDAERALDGLRTRDDMDTDDAEQLRLELVGILSRFEATRPDDA